MWALYSAIEYEGEILHGIFSTKNKAKEAKEYIKSNDYDTQKYLIQEIALDYVFCPSDCFKPKKV